MRSVAVSCVFQKVCQEAKKPALKIAKHLIWVKLPKGLGVEVIQQIPQTLRKSVIGDQKFKDHMKQFTNRECLSYEDESHKTQAEGCQDSEIRVSVFCST